MSEPLTTAVASSEIATLQQVWKQVFDRSTIGPDEDFFSLGGNAWLAADLFTAINQDLSTNLAPATICAAHTIAKLAAVLNRPQLSSPAILLKAGNAEHAPIFMFHGIGSSVVDLVPLVRRMQLDRPIYALESLGNDGRGNPQERIEEMAQSFLAAIRAIQPHGPYFLIGYSFGGLIAFELAHQLKRQSQQIALLVMLDSYPDRHYLSMPQYSRLLLRLAKNRLSRRTRPALARTSSAQAQHSLVFAMQQVKAAHYRALRRYRPQFYDGHINFVRASTPSDFPANPVPVWSHLVRRLAVDTVPGNHVEMLTAGIDPLASLLDRYVRDAQS